MRQQDAQSPFDVIARYRIFAVPSESFSLRFAALNSSYNNPEPWVEQLASFRQAHPKYEVQVSALTHTNCNASSQVN